MAYARERVLTRLLERLSLLRDRTDGRTPMKYHNKMQ